jgi:hypothetical protein
MPDILTLLKYLAPYQFLLNINKVNWESHNFLLENYYAQSIFIKYYNAYSLILLSYALYLYSISLILL